MVYLPLFAMSTAAMAAEAPPGFEQFHSLHEVNFQQGVVDINKDCILFVQQALSHAGLHGSSAGLAIAIWAACLKLLTAPFYE